MPTHTQTCTNTHTRTHTQAYTRKYCTLTHDARAHSHIQNTGVNAHTCTPTKLNQGSPQLNINTHTQNLWYIYI